MNKKILILLTLILIIASALRLWQLGNIPSGITNDEAAYIYSAYSIWKTGADVTGKFLPLSINLDNSFSPVPAYLISPFVGLLGISPFSGRLIFALLSIASVFLIFLIARKLFANSYIALGSAFVFTVSPWDLHVSRAGYEAPIAMFFYLLGFYVFIRKVHKGNICWSLPVFLLAFYSYHGTKVFFLFFITLLIFLHRKHIVNKRIEATFFSLGALTIFTSFLFISQMQHVTRQDVFLWNEVTSATEAVNAERKVNSAPFEMKKIFNNKPLFYLRVIRENYLEAFSTNFLFLYGETGGLGKIYGTFSRGVLYIIELPLLIFGFIYLAKEKNKRSAFLIFFSLFIAPLSSAFTFDRTYVMRSIMMVPFLAIIIGSGIYYACLLLNNRKRELRVVLILTFIFLYTFLISSYLYQYFYRYSIYGAEAWFRSTREILEYVGRQKKEYKNIYLVSNDKMMILQYGVFNKTNPRLIQSAWQTNKAKIENVTFIKDCIDTKGKIFNSNEYLKVGDLYIVPDECHKQTAPIRRITETGEPLRTIWKIYERI